MDLTAQQNAARERGLEPRVGSLEASVAILGTKVDGVAESLGRLSSDVNTTLRTLQGDFNASRRPNFQILLGVASLSVLVCSLIGGMALAPLYMMTSYLRDDTSRALGWEYEYMKGGIPSSADREIAGLKLDFAGQLNSLKAELTGTTKEMETQIQQRKETAVQSFQDIAALKDGVARIRESQAHLLGRLNLE